MIWFQKDPNVMWHQRAQRCKETTLKGDFSWSLMQHNLKTHSIKPLSFKDVWLHQHTFASISQLLHISLLIDYHLELASSIAEMRTSLTSTSYVQIQDNQTPPLLIFSMLAIVLCVPIQLKSSRLLFCICEVYEILGLAANFMKTRILYQPTPNQLLLYILQLESKPWKTLSIFPM